MITIDSSFLTSIGITEGDVTSNSQYSFHNGITVNGVLCSSQYEFFKNVTVNSINYDDQYGFYKAIGVFHSEPIYDQYSFYKNVSFDGVTPVGNQYNYYKGVGELIGFSILSLAGLQLYLDSDVNVNTKIAASFDGANTESLSTTSTDFNFGDEDFTICTLAYVDTTFTPQPSIITKNDGPGFMSYESLILSSGKVRLTISPDGTTTTSLTSNHVLSVNTWYMIFYVYDSVNNLLKVKIDDNEFEVVSHSGGAFSGSTAVLEMGARYGGTNNLLTGRLDAPFVFGKALTFAECEAIRNSGNGTAYDNLTNYNGDTYAIAQSFQTANSNYFSSSSTDYNIGNNDVTFFGWFKVDDSTATSQLLGKWGVSGEYSFSLDVISAIPNKVRFGHSQNGISTGNLASLNSISSGTWFFVTFGYDTTLNEVFIEINDLTRYSTANNTGLYNACPNDFVIGRTSPSGTTSNSSCAQFGMYNRLISTDEQTALYNGGVGVLPSDLDAGQLNGLVSLYGMTATEGATETDLITVSGNNLTANNAPLNTIGNITNTTIATIESSLLDWWELNEESGNRAGELGHTLTDNNTVGYAIGKVQEPSDSGDKVYNWIDQSTNAYILKQDTLTLQPVLSGNSINFNGTDEYLINSTANIFGTDTSGIIFFSGYFDNSSINQICLSMDEATNSHYFGIQVDTAGAIKVLVTSTGVNNIFTCTNTITNGNYFYGYLKSDGSNYTINLNGTDETLIFTTGSDDGKWFSSVLNRDNISIGVGLRLTPFYGVTKSNKIIYSNSTLTDSEIEAVLSIISIP